MSKKWNEEELRLLQEKYPELGLKKMAEVLRRTKLAVKVQAHNLGIRCRQGRLNRWGEVERISDGRVRIYVGNNRRVDAQRLYWERLVGEIPEGYFLTCKSDDRTNPEPSNWELKERDGHLKEISKKAQKAVKWKAFKKSMGFKF